MHGLPSLIKDLTIMLGIASIVILLFQKIRQPIVLGYLVAGMIIGPYTPPSAFISNAGEVQTLSELGVIFLMFSLGLDFSFHKLVRVGPSATFTGFMEVILMMSMGYFTGHMLGWSFENSLFLGAALSISSTTIIIKSLDELKLKTKRFAELIFGILVVEDLLAILLLVGLSAMIATNNVLSFTMFWAVIKLILVVGSWFLIGYFMMPILFRKIMHFVNSETLTITSIALCLMLVSAAAYFDYSVALGSFIMGSILAETSLVHRVEELVRPVRDIFAAVFFISVGMLIDPKIIIEQFPVVLLISAITIVSKITVTGLSTFLTGQSANTSLRVGFGMAQIGEFSFIIAGLGITLGVTSKDLYPIIVAVSAITTFTTPYLIKLSGHLSVRLEEQLSERAKYWLGRYSAWIYRESAGSKMQGFYGKAILRLIINSIIVSVIFTLTDRQLLPKVIEVLSTELLAKILCWVLAILLASPFIWGMLFSFYTKTKQYQGKSSLTPGIVLTWIFTAAEVIILSAVQFDTWLITIFATLLAILFFSLAYRRLEKFYYWFEDRLVSNLQQKDIVTSRYVELAPWDSHLVEVVVGNDSPFANNILGDLELRQKFGVNIVAIYRNGNILLAPRGDEIILSQDKLIILGNDEQIDPFRTLAEKGSSSFHVPDLLRDFALKPFLLAHSDSRIGKTIRNSKIREKTAGIVVGLERNGIRILNPDPATVLQENDVLLIVSKVGQNDLY